MAPRRLPRQPAGSDVAAGSGRRSARRYGGRIDPPSILDAQVVLPCADLGPTVAFFTERLGFRVRTIWPADAPAHAVVAGAGLLLLLEPGDGPPGWLRLRCADPDAVAGGLRTLVAPNGTRVDLLDADPPLVIPPLVPELVVSRAGDGAAWGDGRAGMQYRDLIPGRQGGRFIASHIRIPDAGPVPDYVHFHDIRLQLIFCRRGWVRLVYEDQGPPFVLHEGDCVLQPPRIRHRVLDCSAGMEVVELGCPADHETHADATLVLPTDRVDADRDFGGQRFARHVAAEATWTPWRFGGFEQRDVGIAAATDGLAGVRVVRRAGPSAGPSAGAAWRHGGELLFLFVLDGAITLRLTGAAPIVLGVDDSVTVPAGVAHALTDASVDAQLLEVSLPAVLAEA